MRFACWLDLACQRGITVGGEHGGLLPGVGDAISRTVAVAIWSGLTGYLTLTGSCHVPGKFLPCCPG